MPPIPLPTEFLQDVTFVEVLADQNTTKTVGYCFTGCRSGPNVLFAALSQTIEAVSRRLVKLPTLPWMSGQLYLVALDLLQKDQLQDLTQCVPNLTFHKVYILNQSIHQNTGQNDADAGYWAALRLYSDLGMIQGRGITTQCL